MKYKRSVISIAMATLILVAMASVSVSAATDSSVNVKPSGALVSDPVGSAPAVCSNDGNDLYLFAKSLTGDLLWTHWNINYGWYSWASLGGQMTADPAAVSRSGGRIDVFVSGQSGGLWSITGTNYGQNWGSWHEMGGKLLEGTGPAAYAFPDGRLGWMVTGESHTVWHAWIDAAGGYHDYSPLTGGYLTSSPAVVSQAQDRLDVFGRGASGGLWWTSYHNGWSGWSYGGGQLAPGTGPAACSWGPGRLDVFVTGTDGALWQAFKPNEGAGWGWRYPSLGGSLTSSPAATSSAQGVIEVYARDSNGNICYQLYENGWSGWI